MAGPSDNVISDSVFDRLVALASVEGVKHNKSKGKTHRRNRGDASDNKSKRRTKK
jgi:hypothetical protein